MADRIRIALCDDHAVVRSGLRRSSRLSPTSRSSARPALPTKLSRSRAKPSRTCSSWISACQAGSGIAATADVFAASPATRVLVLTVHDDVAYLRRAFDAGAAGYLVKEAADVEMVQAVRQVAAGKQYVYPSLGAALLAPDAATARPAGPGGELSEREVEVLTLLATGLTNSEIAERLYVSVRTVETHRAHIHLKLNVRTRAEIVRVAREAGVLEADDAL